MCAARNQSLTRELRQYLNNEVEILQSEQRQAIQVVEEIKRAFQQYDNGSSYDFGRIFYQGSSYEGLKVMKADEFDLLVPLNLNGRGWRIASSNEQGASGHYLIKKQNASADATWNMLTEQGSLNPAKVRRNMQSIVQRAVNGMDGSINLRPTGPAITIDVGYDRDSLSIDIVPCLMLNDRSFVAKSPPHSLRNPASDVYDRMWRESFSEQEKGLVTQMDRMNECRRDCLKILKTIQKKRGISQLGMLSSYHLKTCMLHLNADRPDLSWHRDNLADRFKDLLKKLMSFLEKRNMPNFFCRSVNLFGRYDTDSLNNILSWLRGVTRNDDNIINDLLHKRGSTMPTPDNFEIFVKNQNGKSTIYRNMQRSTTVKQLKQEISKEGIPVEQQQLTCEGKPLEDGKTLGDYNIQQGSTIYLLGRLRGG